MDDLLSEFLTETSEHLEGVETQLVQFERDPTDASLVSSIFRLVHTIKGTSSFLGLDRLQAVAHSAETLIGDLRDGAPPTQKTVSLILAAIDRIKLILSEIEILGAEGPGNDADLIVELEAAMHHAGAKLPVAEAQPAPAAEAHAGPAAAPAAAPPSSRRRHSGPPPRRDRRARRAAALKSQPNRPHVPSRAARAAAKRSGSRWIRSSASCSSFRNWC